MGERDDRPCLPPLHKHTHTLGGDRWKTFPTDPGTLTSPGDNPLKSCHCTPCRQGGPNATRLEQAPIRATRQDRHSPLSSRTPCRRGENLGPDFSGFPGHSPSGGETLEKWTNLPQLGERPPPPQERLTAEGGGLETFSQGPPGYTQSGVVPLVKLAAHCPNSASAHPGHQLDLVSAHPVHHTNQPPPLLHASYQRGRPLAKFPQGPLNTHNPGGGLAKWAAHCPDPVSTHPGHQLDSVSDHPGQQP